MNIPAGLTIPPGSILMKNDQGQLMLVPGGASVNTPVRQVLQVCLWSLCFILMFCAYHTRAVINLRS